jgi:hypothetical protein
MAGKLLTDVFSEGSVLFSAMPSPKAEEHLYDAAYRSIVAGTDAVIWVCYQHASNDVKKRLTSKNIHIQNIVFIDMISHMMGLHVEKYNTICCASPTDYSCMFRSLEELFDRHGRCLVVIDNINAMMSYDMLERLIKTIRNLNNIIPQKNSAMIYLEILGACDAKTQITLQTTMNSTLNIDHGYAKYDSWEDVKKITWNDVFSLNNPAFFCLILTMMNTIILLTFILIMLVIGWKV